LVNVDEGVRPPVRVTNISLLLFVDKGKINDEICKVTPDGMVNSDAKAEQTSGYAQLDH